MIAVILGEINAFIFLLFDNAFMYRKISILGDTVSPDRIISCLSLIIFILKYSGFSPFLNGRVDRSD